MRTTVFAGSVGASCGTVALSGLLAASLQSGFGVSDLTFLVTWFVPLGLAAAALAAFALQSASRWPLPIETESDDGLSDAEVALVRAAQTSGRLVAMWGGSRHGRGPAAAALILVKEPLTRPVSFRQPDRATAVYVQGTQGFSVYPADTKVLDREITLSPQEGGVWCSVQIANGGIQSGPVRIW